jgi:hypothetical protein
MVNYAAGSIPKLYVKSGDRNCQLFQLTSLTEHYPKLETMKTFIVV